MMRRAACLLILAAASWAADAWSADIQVSEPWVRAPAAVKTHAGYMRIDNRSAAPVVLVGVESPSYERVEFHATRTEGGVAAMQAVAQLEIPAGGSVRFEPLGLHVMLIGPRRTIAPGDRLPLVLLLADGTRIEAQAEVRRGAAAGHDHHHRHGSHGAATH